MSRLTTAFARSRSRRASLRTERALRRALATAPTTESAHELQVLASRR